MITHGDDTHDDNDKKTQRVFNTPAVTAVIITIIILITLYHDMKMI